MKKLLVLMLVFAAFGFAAQANIDGDVLLTVPNEEGMAPKSAITNSFTVGTRATTEVIRDMCTGSDFDADGKKEVLLASYDGGGKAYVYEITGDNTAELMFETKGFGSALSAACRDVRFGDLDGNGKQELIVSINSANVAIGGLWVYEYDTVGDSMRAPVQILSSLVTGDRWYVENMTIGDVDGDGVQEIIFGNNGNSNAKDNFYIASVDSGDFASGKVRTKIEFTHGKSSATFPAGGSPYGGVIADMDGDGHKEVLFAPWDMGALFIVEADSANHYSALNYIKVDLDARDDFAFYDFAPADLDKDGRDEVYISMYDAGALYVITCPVGTELSALTTANVHRLEPMGGSGGVCTQIGDFDGNGRMNIYASNGGSTITVHEHQGGDPTDVKNWIKLNSLTDSNFNGIYGMRYAGDLDGDGYDEIYAANTGTVSTARAVAIEMDYEYLDLALTFDDASDVANWSHWDEANGWTVEAWGADSTLVLSDGGYGFIAKRPVVATPGWIYKLSVDIKTSLWTGASNVLELSVQGLGNDNVKYSCISDGVWTKYTIIGVAESDSGYIRIGGSKSGTVDTVFVDNVIWDEGYLDVFPSSDVATARKAVIGDTLATIGTVTTTTNYGTSGPVYIQDGSAGIAVYNYAAAQNVALGDEILVIGKMKDYNGLLEIDPVIDYIVLSKDNVVEPTIITALDMADRETYEGMLVTIEKCDTTDAGILWPASGSNKGFNLKDDVDSTFYCYIDKDTDIDGSPKPTAWPLDISGIVSDYNGAQLMPRSLADIKPSNQAPGAFTIVSPADETVITSLVDPNIKKVLIGADSVMVLFTNWTKAVDPDAGDIVTYQMMISPEGPEEELVTLDTFLYIPLNEEKPWEMNGSYEVFVVATDILGASANSDTISITFDFPSPPEIIYSDVVLLGGSPKLYALFNMPVEKVAVANFMILDQNALTVTAPTDVDSIAPNAVLISGDLTEGNRIALAYNGIVTTGGAVSTVDTIDAGEVLIPFSANHPEDAAKVIANFETTVGSFLDPNYSGSTTGLQDSSKFEVSADAAYRGTKSGKMTLWDNPAVSGGWYVRDLYGYPFTYTVKTSSKIMFMVKGTNANVEMRLSVKDTGYEQGPWTRVSLSEDDWQVVSFDLPNDKAEGWVNGNGIVEGSTVVIEGIHMRCSEDVDVVLYIDEFTERQLYIPRDVTFKVNMSYWTKLGKFNPATDSVDIAGSFNNWGGNSIVLSDANGDTTYDVTVPGFYPTSSLSFKFRINGSWNDATCEFPMGGANRTYVVPDSNSVYSAWYNDQVDPGEGIAEAGLLPTIFALHQNYPNPFNPITTIKYDLPKDAHVRIVIYDMMGHEVRTLINSNQQAGYQAIQWNALNNQGKQVSSGYYIYVMQAGNFLKTQKMILLK
ncbi:MAG: FG-GAP-like repeat-containing protein [Candidatus Marinimicrobia bacterium]|nr:FG-GAP-like repeat-containing protein [Candidatus Neomarinimicrobiota bacterium]